MNTRDEARLSMYQAVIDFLKKNPAITAILPQFPEILAALELNVEKLLQLGQELNSDRSGVADTKKGQKAEIELRSVTLSGKMVAFATLEKNNELLKLIKLTKTTLSRSKDNDLMAHALKLCDAAEAHLPQLTDYTVTQAEVTALRDLCAAFLVNLPKPNEGKKDRAEVNRLFKNLLKETDGLFLKLDALMLIVKYSKSEFYAHYSSSSAITVTGARKLTVKCKITDAATGLGLPGALISFEPVNGTSIKSKAGADLVKNVKKASVKGGLNLKTMDTGTYLVTVKKNGFVTQTATVYVNDGELTSVNMALQPE